MELKAYRFLGFDEIYTDSNMGRLYYLKSEADKVIAEKDAEIARLKAIRKVHIESIESMCEGLKLNAKQICKTQRALWLARAERAKETQFLWQVYCHCDKLYFCKPFCVTTRKNPYRHISHMNVVEWDEFWGKIKNKCLAKAEEYKLAN